MDPRAADELRNTWVPHFTAECREFLLDNLGANTGVFVRLEFETEDGRGCLAHFAGVFHPEIDDDASVGPSFLRRIGFDYSTSRMMQDWDRRRTRRERRAFEREIREIILKSESARMNSTPHHHRALVPPANSTPGWKREVLSSTPRLKRSVTRSTGCVSATTGESKSEQRALTKELRHWCRQTPTDVLEELLRSIAAGDPQRNFVGIDGGLDDFIGRRHRLTGHLGKQAGEVWLRSVVGVQPGGSRVLRAWEDSAEEILQSLTELIEQELQVRRTPSEYCEVVGKVTTWLTFDRFSELQEVASGATSLASESEPTPFEQEANRQPANRAVYKRNPFAPRWAASLWDRGRHTVPTGASLR